jgi:hypothetical protein
VLARFLEIGTDHVLGIGLGFRFRQPHLPRGPFAEQPVAPGGDPELHFLVVRELGLEGPLAVVKLGHAFPLCICQRK